MRRVEIARYVSPAFDAGGARVSELVAAAVSAQAPPCRRCLSSCTFDLPDRTIARIHGVTSVRSRPVETSLAVWATAAAEERTPQECCVGSAPPAAGGGRASPVLGSTRGPGQGRAGQCGRCAVGTRRRRAQPAVRPGRCCDRTHSGRRTGSRAGSRPVGSGSLRRAGRRR